MPWVLLIALILTACSGPDDTYPTNYRAVEEAEYTLKLSRIQTELKDEEAKRLSLDVPLVKPKESKGKPVVAYNKDHRYTIVTVEYEEDDENDVPDDEEE